MRSVNKVILVGNLTRDPELKSTTNGQSICTFGLATNRVWKDQNGEQKDLVEFHEVTAWARRAEICHQILKKGNLAYIEGYLKTRNWVDEETQKKRYRTEVVVDDVIKLEKRANGDDASEPVAANEDDGAAAEAAFGAAAPAEEKSDEKESANF